jgi:hypothetical protein
MSDNEKKIIVNLDGGLGNQMFCYAFYKKLLLDYPEKHFCLDISKCYNPDFSRNCELLHIFKKIDAEIAERDYVKKVENRIYTTYRGKGSKLLNCFVEKINAKNEPKSLPRSVTESNYCEWESKNSTDKWEKVDFFSGFWQDINLYKDNWEYIKSDFVFDEVLDSKNLMILDEIKSTEAVSVHVRRGLYAGVPKFDILTTDYYSKIINDIRANNPDSRFFFFSDDGEYVKKEYSWLDNKVIVDINRGNNSYKDMILMSGCRTNVVANSTFSLWAAFLNSNEGRKVYYPSYFFRGERPLDFGFLDGFYKVDV